MTRYFLSPLLIILPILVLFSGMAMTPFLILLAGTGAAVGYDRIPAQFKTLRYSALCLGLLLLWPLITTLWSVAPDHSLQLSLQMIALGAIGLIAFATAPSFAAPDPRTYYYMATHVAVVGVVIAVERIVSHGLLYELMSALGKDYDRFILKNINRGLCALTVFIWPLVFGLLRTGQQRTAWWATGLLLIGILAMHSLSAKLGLLAGIFAFYAIARFPRLMPRAIVILIPLLLLSFPLLFKLAEVTVFENSTILEHLPMSSLHRLAIWDIHMHFIEKEWLLGYGMDATRALPLTAEELAALGLTEPPLHPHSPSIQLLLEQGMIGFLLSIGGVTLLLRQWLRMENGLAKATAGAIIVSYFVSGMFSFGIWQSWWIASLFIALFLWRIIARMEA